MPYAQTSTSLGALSTAVAGSWVQPPRGVNQVNTGGGAGPVVVIVASAVTTGAVVSIEGRNSQSAVDPAGNGFTATKELHRVTIAANGNTIIPLKDLLDTGVAPDQIRVNVVSRTDGTYTCSVLTPS